MFPNQGIEKKIHVTLYKVQQHLKQLFICGLPGLQNLSAQCAGNQHYSPKGEGV